MSSTRAPAFLLLVAVLLGPSAMASEPAAIEPGPPSVEIDAPALALAGVPLRLTVRPSGTLPADGLSLRLVDAHGRVVEQGVLEASGELTIEFVARRGDGPWSLESPTHAGSLDVAPRVVPGWLSLMPPVLAILLALVFRQVIPALLAGIWVGAWIAHGGPFTGALRTIDGYIVATLGDSGRVSILVFSLLLGGMVGVVSRSGGTLGLVESLRPYATSSRRGQLVTWLLGLLVFFDDYANSLLVGNTMRPVTDRLRVSREKLAFIVDSTAAPVASIGLISTWIGYEVSLIAGSLKEIGSDLSAYGVFLQALPYNFYPLLALVFGFLIAWTGRDFGPMLTAERRAAAGQVLAPGAVPLADFDNNALQAVDGKPRRWLNAVLPIVVVLLVTFLGLWFTGRASLAADGGAPLDGGWLERLGAVFSAGDSYRALLYASLSGCLVALLLAIGQRILTMADGLSAWVNGVKSMTMAIIILILAWSIADVCGALNTRGYMVALLSDTLDPRLLPALVFCLAAVTAFATGSSWGTMGILIPLAVPTAHALAQAAGFGPEATHAIFLGSVSSVLAGAIFGDHCSPISDTTVLSSMASACDHVDHVRTQLPYAVLVALVALVTGYVPSAYGLSPFLSLLLGSAVLVGALFWLGRRRG